MEVDYVVIGGGINGVWTAYHLARDHGSVLLIERESLAPPCPLSSSGEPVKQFRCAHGSNRAMTDLSVEALRMWRQMEELSGTQLLIPTGWVIFEAEQPSTRSRWPDYASPPPGFARASQATLERAKLPCTWLSAAAVRERYPQLAENPYYDGALIDESCHLIRAKTAVEVVGRLARAAGAEIWENVRVERVERDATQITGLETSRYRVIPKRAVIFAAGYMNPTLAPELRAKTSVVHARLLVVRPERPANFEPSLFPTVGTYAFPLHDNGVTKIAPGESPIARHIDPNETEPLSLLAMNHDEFVSHTRAVVAEWIPELARAPAVEVRTCFYTLAGNGSYIIDRRSNSVMLMACSNMGFKHAPVSGLMAARLARASDPAATPHPLYLDEFRLARAPDVVRA